MSPQELIGYCAQHMAKFMVPRFVRFATSLPKTPTDKVEKFRLKQEGVSQDTWDREKVAMKR